MRNIVRRAFCWPLYLGTLVALAAHALWGEFRRWDDGVLVIALAPTSWPVRTRKTWLGTCLGYGILLAPGQQALEHEKRHVEQYEASSVGGLLLGFVVLLITRSWAGLGAFVVMWIASFWFMYLGASVVAWLRGEANAYRGNHLEEAARDATK